MLEGYVRKQDIDQLLKLVERLNKNPECHTKISIKVEEALVEFDGRKYKESYAKISGIDENFASNGWRFIAKIERREEGVIISSYPYLEDNYELPEMFKSNAALEVFSTQCWHCNKIRNRNVVYWLENKDDNRGILVGSSCIKDFLLSDPTKFLTELEGLFGFVLPTLQDEYLASQKPVLYLENIIYWSYLVISDAGMGYVSSKKSYEDNLPRTQDTVRAIIFANSAIRDEVTKKLNIKERKVPVDEIIEKAKEILAEKEWSEFNHNLLTILSSEVVSEQSIGLACYIPELVLREERKIKTTITSTNNLKTCDRIFKINSESSFQRFSSQYGDSLKVVGVLIENNIELPASFFLNLSRKHFDDELKMLKSGELFLVRSSVEFNEKYGNSLKRVSIKHILK